MPSEAGGRVRASGIGSRYTLTAEGSHPVTDFLETKRNEIAKRLAELKPLIDEYSLLQAAAIALDGVPSANGAAAPPRPRACRLAAVRVVHVARGLRLSLPRR